MDEPTSAEVEKLLLEMGLPMENPGPLAEQLLKRAIQLAGKRGWSVRHALDHLIGLLRQGWAAKNKG
jgi:hypothetical protein